MQEEYHPYNPIVIGLVLNIEKDISKVKKQLIDVIKDLEADDRGYVYHPDNLEILKHSGPVVASIANYIHPKDFDIEIALKQTLILAGMEDDDSKKHVFVIVDDYEEDWTYRLNKAIKMNEREECGCKIYFIGLDCEVPLPNSYDIDLNDLSKLIKEKI
jgi:hypothetical protein